VKMSFTMRSSLVSAAFPSHFSLFILSSYIKFYNGV
jgi:hypothetical protein